MKTLTGRKPLKLHTCKAELTPSDFVYSAECWVVWKLFKIFNHDPLFNQRSNSGTGP